MSIGFTALHCFDLSGKWWYHVCMPRKTAGTTRPTDNGPDTGPLESFDIYRPRTEDYVAVPLPGTPDPVTQPATDDSEPFEYVPGIGPTERSRIIFMPPLELKRLIQQLGREAGGRSDTAQVEILVIRGLKGYPRGSVYG